MVRSLVRLFLVSDVSSNDLFIVADGRYKIASRPKVIAAVFALLRVFVSDVKRCPSLQKPDDVRDRVFRWDRDQHMHVVRHQVSFLDPAPLLQAQPYEQIAQLEAKITVKPLRPVFAGKNHVILAVPSRM